MQTTANDLVKRSKGDGGVDKEDAVQSIDTMITRVENLKRKVSGTVHHHSWRKCLKLPALGSERERRYTHSSSDERTSPTPLGRRRCRNPNHLGVPTVVRYEVRQVAHRLDITHREGKDRKEDHNREGHICQSFPVGRLRVY